MRTTYEWGMEILDGEDIIETHHAGRINDLLPYLGDGRLVLIRDTGDDIGGLIDRMWAYPENGMLPKHFTYCDGEENGYRIPQRFHREIAAFTARHGVI